MSPRKAATVEPEHDEPTLPEAGSADEPEQPERICQASGCDQPLPANAHKARRYCDEHQPRTPANRRLRGEPPRPPGRPRKDAKPPSVGPLGSPPKRETTAEVLATVERNAKFLCEGAAAVLLMVGQAQSDPTLLEDAADVQRGAGQWARAVREVSVHEDWLRRLLSGGKGSDRALAWMMFAVSTGTIALPILVRHKMIPADLADMVGPMVSGGAGPPG